MRGRDVMREDVNEGEVVCTVRGSMCLMYT